MLPKRIWLLLSDEDRVVAISFEELPPTQMPHVRRAVRYDCMLARERTNGALEQLQLFEGTN